MKLNYNFKNKIERFLILVIIFCIVFFQFNFHTVNAFSMSNNRSDLIIEELRLKIPMNYKETWLEAEKYIWQPWLSNQEGFLGRQLFWDKDKEEALILVSWENKELWKKISMEEVNEVQKLFDEKVQKSLNLEENPFKLIYEGELFKQG